MYRQLNLKLSDGDTTFSQSLINAIGRFSRLITVSHSNVSSIALWFINVTINDLSGIEEFTQLVAEVLNSAINIIPTANSMGQLFESLIFVKYRLNTICAIRAAYRKKTVIDISSLEIFFHLMLKTAPTFSFYSEIFDCVETLCDILVVD